MTTRERWIVYPLLIFCLMMGIKSQYFQVTFKAKRIECSDLTVTSINGRPAQRTATIRRISPRVVDPPTGVNGLASPDGTDPAVDDVGNQAVKEQPSTDPASVEPESSQDATHEVESSDRSGDEPPSPPEAVEAAESTDTEAARDEAS